MKRYFVILAFVGCLPLLADDGFVDDIYYLPSKESEKQIDFSKPNFNKKAKELVFVQDTLSTVEQDTIQSVVLQNKNR